MDDGLLSWFSLSHPRYRGLMAQLLLVTTIAGGLVYAQNNLLTWLTQTLVESVNAGRLAAAASESRWLTVLQETSQHLKMSLPLMLLLLLVLVSLILSLFEFRRVQAVGQLRIRSRNDLESQILGHLLRQDDAFFASHSPAETVNRINIDLNRVSERRPNLMRVWWCLVLLVTYLIFFWQKDWRLALVVIAAPMGSALLTHRMMARVKKMDRRYLHEDDLVKASFEDYLRASPEIQVGRLYPKIHRDFGVLQEGRAATFLRFVNLTGWLRVGDHLSGMLALAGAIAVVMYYRQVGQGSTGLALLPVVLLALPDLFKSTSDLIFLYVDFQLARTSMHRLLEYETQAPPPQALQSPVLAGTEVAPQGMPLPGVASLPQPPSFVSPAAALRLENVTYRYQSPDRRQQGGVRELSAIFSPGRWIAIMGPAGCGKSTLLQLLLGRVQPDSGRILYGSRSLESCESIWPLLFSYMPQSPAILNTTIRKNLLFGKASASGPTSSPGTLTPADLEVVEATGLGLVCRLKALDLLPGSSTLEPETAGMIAGLREKALSLLGSPDGQGIRPPLNPGEGLEINPYLSWRENLFAGAPERSCRSLDQALLEIIEAVGLNLFFTERGLDFPVGRLGGNLSGGQGQLVALCRALLRRTPVLILDEPTSSLDPASSLKVARLLQQWKSSGGLIVSVSHNPDFVRLADEIYLMEDSRIAAHGTFEEIAANSVLFRRTLEAP